jgi:hypothetical protein
MSSKMRQLWWYQVLVPTTQKPFPNGSLQKAMGGARHLRTFAHTSRQRSLPLPERLQNHRVKVDMNWRPVSLISANFVGSLGRSAPGRFLGQSDLRVTTFENDVFRHRSSDLGKSHGVAIKSQAFIEQRNVNGCGCCRPSLC